MRPLTFAYPYYNQPLMLQQQINHLRQNVAQSVCEHLTVVIVDDYSDPEPYGYPIGEVLEWGGFTECEMDFRLRCYRITEDRDINWQGAKNLAMQEAETEWVFLTDIDHVVPEKTWRCWMSQDLDELHYYIPARVWADGEPHKRHPNSFLIHQVAFWAAGGYDEDWAGTRSGGEAEFQRALREREYEPVKVDEIMRLWGYGDCPDANIPKPDELAKERNKRRQKIREKKRKGELPSGAVNPIRFDWHEVCDVGGQS